MGIKAFLSNEIKPKEIAHNMVILSPTSFRAILEVHPINFSLRDELEKEGIISMFEHFLNSLLFDIQILVVSRTIDVEGYVKRIEEYARNETNPILRNQALSHVEFVRRLVIDNNLLRKHIYIIIPYEDSSSLPPKGRGEEEWERRLSRARTNLNQRVSSVRNLLSSVGVSCRELNTYEIAELFYHFYNPNKAQIQRLRKEELEGYGSLAIVGKKMESR